MNTDEMNRRGLGERIFSFAVITDTHTNEDEEVCSSPFPVNKLANGRTRYVFNALNGHDLSFVIHVGDIIHPVPSMRERYENAAALFHKSARALRHDLFLVPGNHDIGDKPNDWAPAGVIQEEYLTLWGRNFGADHYAFDRDGCRFIIINAQVINSGLEAETLQREWLQAEHVRCHGKRVFVFTHYPLFLAYADEPENYDNIAEPGRSWLLNLLSKTKAEALFAGHVHNFWYNRYAGTDHYLLPSTSFVRQDYSEMFRASPGLGDEAGRNDRAKLGYFLVHVHEHGHAVDFVRTYGAMEPVGQSTTRFAKQVEASHPKTNRHASLGFDMRHDWMEHVEIPPMGGLDEFDRKQVRNDYPLLALWEMGIRRLRIPLRDLSNARARERLRDLRQHGHVFTLFTFGAPDSETRELILSNKELLEAWEVVIRPEPRGNVMDSILDVARRSGVSLYLSKLRSPDELRREAGRYYHAINHGFVEADVEEMKALAADPALSGILSGFVFRATAERHAWDSIKVFSGIAEAMGVGAIVHLRMRGANPADAMVDDTWVADRLVEAAMAAAAFPDVTVFADTFIDNDRGYFVRHGVLDRLCNPRSGFSVLRHLHGALNWDTGPFEPLEVKQDTEARLVSIRGNRHVMSLILPNGSGGSGVFADGLPERFHRVDLMSGAVSTFAADDGPDDIKSRGQHEKTPLLFIHEDRRADR